jgi:P27 family predicted phage terminase small subunit
MGLRGPAPKSRDRKILEGTFRRDRDQGATLAPPTLERVPPAPKHLTALGKREWRRVAAELIGLGALGEVALATLSGYASAYARAMRLEAQQAKLQELTKDDVSSATKAWAQVLAFATKLGINPADHTRVKVRERKPDATVDPWAGVANG